MYPILKLKAGKEANVGFRHPWVFSGAIQEKPEGLVNGELVHVADRKGDIIGTGTYSAHSSITVRVFEFKEATIDEAWFVEKFRQAEGRRAALGLGSDKATTGYRLVFGESDGLPGLVVDRYDDVLVIQISSVGMDALRETILSAMEEVWKPKSIVERSDIPSRKEEGLEEVSEIRKGEAAEPVEFSENGLKFAADVVAGQKTGFFLDQKDLRAEIMKMADGKDVLNLFSYSGAAGIAAMKGGAKSVLNVDASEGALELCKVQAKMNGIKAAAFKTEASDAFQFLGAKDRPMFGMVIMDPPALIKSRKDIDEGAKAYHFLNRAAMRLVEDGGIFVTSSCSHYWSEEDFAFILRRASVQAGIRLDILKVVRQSADHPLSIYFPEASYLKSFICLVRR